MSALRLCLFCVCIFTLTAHGSVLPWRHYSTPYPELQYTVTKTWDNQTTEDNAEINVSFQVVDDFFPYGRGLVVRFESPYYNNPPIADTVPTSKPFLGLWNYEVVEAFFLGNDEEYLEIVLGPKGHYILLLLKGPNYNLITYQLPLTNYTAACSTVSQRWLGEAYIPGEYFPCNVSRFNAFAIHGSEPSRVHMALSPVAKGEYETPDFHRLQAFQPISLGVELNPKCARISTSPESHPHHETSGDLPAEEIPEVVDS